LDKAIQNANAEGKMVMLDFYADWCISCKEMEKYTFSDPEVQKELRKMVLLQADVTENDSADQALLKRFSLSGPPSMLFFDRNGKEKRNYRLVGFLKIEKFLPHIRSVQQ
jgi:thiol:disulfide interchange protein DsbD